MGYYTNFEIIRCNSITAKNYLKNHCSGYEKSWNGDMMLDVKWYEWEEDLKKTSEKFPDNVIVIEGRGEDSDDSWRAYALGGHVEIVKKTWPDEPVFIKNYKESYDNPEENGWLSAEAMIKGDTMKYVSNPYKENTGDYKSWETGFKNKLKECYFKE